MLAEKINSLEEQLQSYMNEFSTLVSSSINAEQENRDVGQIASSLKDSHQKMVAIVKGMKFLDQTEGELYQKVQAFEAKNEQSTKRMNLIDQRINDISLRVEDSLGEVAAGGSG